MAQKKQNQTISLVDYLCSDALMEKHYLTTNKNIAFHWSYWERGCEFQQERFSHYDKRKKLNELDKFFEELKTTTAVVRQKISTLKISLYDLYSMYVDASSSTDWEELSEGSQISMVGEAGPYVSIDSMRWFDKEIYSAFIFAKLIKGEVPRRKFRLGVNIPVECEFDESPLRNEMIHLHQLGLRGALFRVEGGHVFNKFKNAKEVALSFNLKPFIAVNGATAMEASKHFSKIDFNIINHKDFTSISFDLALLEEYGNAENAKLSNGKEYYFYLPYSDLKNLSDQADLEVVFSNFVKSFEEHFEEELDFGHEVAA